MPQGPRDRPRPGPYKAGSDRALTRRPQARPSYSEPQPGLHMVDIGRALKWRAPAGPAVWHWHTAGPAPAEPSGCGPQPGFRTADPRCAFIRRAQPGFHTSPGQPLKGAPAGLFYGGPSRLAYESRTAPQLMAPASHSDCGPPLHGRHTALPSRTFIRWAPAGPSNGWPQPALAGPSIERPRAGLSCGGSRLGLHTTGFRRAIPRQPGMHS